MIHGLLIEIESIYQTGQYSWYIVFFVYDKKYSANGTCWTMQECFEKVTEYRDSIE